MKSVPIFCWKKESVAAFTLVELIVVITILAILSTIAFIAYQGYTLESRDSKRMLQTSELSKGVSMIFTKSSKYPEEASMSTISSGATLLAKQSKIGSALTSILWSSSNLFSDTTNQGEYIYTINSTWKKAQISSFLEKQREVTANLSSGSINKYLFTKGDSIPLLLASTTYDPIGKTTIDTIDVATSTNPVTAYIGSTSTGGLITYNTPADLVANLPVLYVSGYSLPVSGGGLANYFSWNGTSASPWTKSDGSVLLNCQSYNTGATTNNAGVARGAGVCGDGSQSCLTSGVYAINPGTGNVNIYCDMASSGGGWTLVAKITTSAATCGKTPTTWYRDTSFNCNQTDLTPAAITSARYGSYESVPFVKILLKPEGGSDYVFNAWGIKTSFISFVNSTANNTAIAVEQVGTFNQLLSSPGGWADPGAVNNSTWYVNRSLSGYWPDDYHVILGNVTVNYPWACSPWAAHFMGFGFFGNTYIDGSCTRTWPNQLSTQAAGVYVR